MASGMDSEMDLDESPNDMRKANILDAVAKSNAFFKSQQRGEADLTFQEKRKIAEDLLDTNVVLFLQRYWKFLNIRDISFFDDVCKKYEIDYYLEEIRKLHNAKKSRARIRNRRYEAMKEMKKSGSYFSDAEMEQRNPLLYEQLVGRYMSAEEKCATKQEEMKNMTFSEFLIKQIDHNCTNHLMKMQEDQETAVVEEHDDDSESEDSDDISREIQTSATLPQNERQMLKNEFVNIMCENFLSGKDKNFDYSTIDDNIEYDSVQQREIDEEEKYFDDDSSEYICDSEL